MASQSTQPDTVLAKGLLLLVTKRRSSSFDVNPREKQIIPVSVTPRDRIRQTKPTTAGKQQD